MRCSCLNTCMSLITSNGGAKIVHELRSTPSSSLLQNSRLYISCVYIPAIIRQSTLLKPSHSKHRISFPVALSSLLISFHLDSLPIPSQQYSSYTGDYLRILAALFTSSMANSIADHIINRVMASQHPFFDHSESPVPHPSAATATPYTRTAEPRTTPAPTHCLAQLILRVSTPSISGSTSWRLPTSWQGSRLSGCRRCRGLLSSCLTLPG